MKCKICGGPVDDPEEMFDDQPWMINGAIIGQYVEVKGHKRCAEAVNRLVVIPNRIRIDAFFGIVEKYVPKKEQNKIKNLR